MPPECFRFNDIIPDPEFNSSCSDKVNQPAALLAVGSICGADRSYDSIMVKDDAEECLRRLIYATAANSSKLTPSAYRLISVLVVRPWSLMEVCSKQEIINMVTDAKMETTKKGMEARHECCVAISNALSTSNRLNDAVLAGIAAKLQEAIKRGPYLAKRHIESQPVVVTADRF
ncbi:hypothetical protein QJS10_CPB20g01790 [Acorus calamus]|uniref:Uncharacterized protein n=1 Tax=Acorus calamus TaxID=4465 RepID=A0AAV9CC74_ACOCL|nr:hypothetical protein QJS10_CPB20g01790 [Acorus calamus]